MDIVVGMIIGAIVHGILVPFYMMFLRPSYLLGATEEVGGGWRIGIGGGIFVTLISTSGERLHLMEMPRQMRRNRPMSNSTIRSPPVIEPKQPGL